MLKINKKQFDVVVIGAGPAGLASARAALNQGKRVLILDLSCNGKTRNHSVFLKPKINVSGLGGAARSWGGQICLANYTDLEPWLAHLDYRIEDIERIVQDQIKFAQKLEIPIHELTYFQPKLFETENWTLNHRKTVILKPIDILHYFDDVLISPNLEYLGGVAVEKLVLRNGLAVSILLKNGEKLNSQLIELNTESKLVVVAAGSISSSIILHRSMGKSKNLKSGIITDHPSGTFIYFSSRKFRSNLQVTAARKTKLKYEIIGKKSFADSKIVFEVREKFPSMSLRKAFTKPIKQRAQLAENIVFQLNKLPIIKEIVLKPYQIWIQIEQMPNDKNIIEFEKGETHSKYRYRKEDFAILNFAIDSIVSILDSEKVSIKQVIRPSSNNISEAYHPSGLLIGSHFDSKYTLKKFGEVDSIRNLIVSSSATFPSQSWVNPTLLIMTMAEISIEKKLKTLTNF